MTILAPVRPVFRALVATVVPDANRLDEQGWREVEILLEATLRDRPPAMLRQFRLFLRTMQWLCVVRYGRPFTSLSLDKRTQVLSHLQNHRIELIRCGFWGVRTLAFLGYYARKQALKEIGYAADPRGWEAVR